MTRFAVYRLFAPLLLAAIVSACGKKAPPPPPTIPVNVAAVRRTDIPVLIRATGTVEPIQTVEVQAQISGLLLHVRFKEGDVVEAGQVLFEIDPRPLQAALDQARGNISRDVAQWQSAQHDVERFQSLSVKGYVTEQQLDQAKATAGGLVGTLHGDTAAVEQARLNLQYATIHAPISGRTGSLLVHEGNQVRSGVGQTLVVVNQMSPILVRFPVPADSFEAVRARASKSLAVSAAPGSDSTHLEAGRLIFLDNSVDSLTGTVALKGTFANTDGALWPGALVRVTLQLDVEHNALVVPGSAVQSGQAGDVVWIVDSTQKARVVKVKVLRNTDSMAVLTGGLTAGQQVITDGQLRLTDGIKVSVRTPGARGGAADSTAKGRSGDTAANRPAVPQ
jgi:multidrug efflux system membrane fusion protein